MLLTGFAPNAARIVVKPLFNLKKKRNFKLFSFLKPHCAHSAVFVF